VFGIDATMELAYGVGAKNFFCICSDKAANPVSMMGASKRIMEMFLNRRSGEIPYSAARFANVAFSDGSLLYGFNRRIEKGQPLSAPCDVKRYFITPQESGELCLLSCLMGENRDTFFPKLDFNANLIPFSDIAERYLRSRGWEPVRCSTEQEARDRVAELKARHQYPVYFFESDTTGEKPFEEFFTEEEDLDMDRFAGVGIIRNKPEFDSAVLDHFTEEIAEMHRRGQWTREELIRLSCEVIPNFNHFETGKFLDGRM
jgi:FlaA1/EpsC-like NDP-sugar epimerase